MQYQGISYGAVLSDYRHDSRRRCRRRLAPQAVKRIETRLVLEAIAKAENIEVTEERLDEEIKKMAEVLQHGS